MLMISRDTYLQTVRKIRKLDKQTKAHAKFLQVNPMFAGLPQSVLMHIARSMDEKTMKRGSVILKQGQAAISSCCELSAVILQAKTVPTFTSSSLATSSLPATL